MYIKADIENTKKNWISVTAFLILNNMFVIGCIHIMGELLLLMLAFTIFSKSIASSDAARCIEKERKALLSFKQGLVYIFFPVGFLEDCCYMKWQYSEAWKSWFRIINFKNDSFFHEFLFLLIVSTFFLSWIVKEVLIFFCVTISFFWVSMIVLFFKILSIILELLKYLSIFLWNKVVIFN